MPLDPLLIGLLIGSFLLGSTATAIIVCKLFGLPDPRTQGSKNPGATNVKRIGGTLPAAITLLGDFGKGALAVGIGILLNMNDTHILLMGCASFLGHVFPVYTSFRHGGKGVATFLGVIWTIAPLIGLGTTLIWLAIAKGTKYSSLSALIAIPASLLMFYFVEYSRTDLAILAVMCAILIWRHKGNISRLISGTET